MKQRAKKRTQPKEYVLVALGRRKAIAIGKQLVALTPQFGTVFLRVPKSRVIDDKATGA
jgi:hypothetical protein